MAMNHVHIPYGAYWSSPFCRWQGGLSGLHSLECAAGVAKRAMADRHIAPSVFDGVSLGMTVPQRRAFYGAPWLAGMIGAEGVTGPTVAQACATSARLVANAAMEVETGARECVLSMAADRTSFGPHLYYPSAGGPGGRGDSEDWVWDNFNLDPWAGSAMIQTAENVVRETGITRAQQDEAAALRFSQYQRALADDRAFQRRYMVHVEVPRGRKEVQRIDADEGIAARSAESLASQRAVLEGGIVTGGAQTHPADGNAALVVCNEARARELSRDAKVTVRVLGFGESRVKKGYMPMAPVPAARRALEHAGIGVADLRAVTTHNPFAINDVHLSRELGIGLETVNAYGSPLIYGHPQAPTGLRAIIELIETLVLAGGGHGLYTGCAAGDSGMAVVLRVG